MTSAEILESLRENYEDVLLADGFEDALIGVIIGACREPVAAYDHAKCVRILMERDHMEEDEAEEYMEFNVTGAYVGKLTPLFVCDWRQEVIYPPCIGNDPLCPCQDGDMCHYKGPGAWPIPERASSTPEETPAEPPA